MIAVRMTTTVHNQMAEEKQQMMGVLPLGLVLLQWLVAFTADVVLCLVDWHIFLPLASRFAGCCCYYCVWLFVCECFVDVFRGFPPRFHQQSTTLCFNFNLVYNLLLKFIKLSVVLLCWWSRSTSQPLPHCDCHWQWHRITLCCDDAAPFKTLTMMQTTAGKMD